MRWPIKSKNVELLFTDTEAGPRATNYRASARLCDGERATHDVNNLTSARVTR